MRDSVQLAAPRLVFTGVVAGNHCSGDVKLGEYGVATFTAYQICCAFRKIYWIRIRPDTERRNETRFIVLAYNRFQSERSTPFENPRSAT
jgi:hypothetical protein